MKRFAILLAAAFCFAAVVRGETPPVRQADQVINTVVGATLIQYSVDGKWCATVGEDGHIRLWDAATGELGQTLRGHEGSVKAMMFLADGKTLVSVGEDKTVRTWDFAAGKELSNVEVKLADDGMIALRPMMDATRDVEMIECTNAELRFWNCAKGELEKIFKGADKPNGNTCVAWRPNGKEYVAGNSSGGWQRVDETHAIGGGAGLVPKEAYSPVKCIAASESTVAAGYKDGRVLLWKGDAMDPVTIRTPQSGTAKAIVFGSKDALVAAVVGKDVMVWDVASGKLVCTMSGSGGEVQAVAFSPDGKKMASGDESGEMRYWTLP